MCLLTRGTDGRLGNADRPLRGTKFRRKFVAKSANSGTNPSNMRRLLVVVVAAALVAAAPAGAKSPPQGLACGAAGCTAIADRDAVYALTDAQWQPFTLLAAPRPAPYFLVVLYAPDPLGFSWTVAYVPSRHAVKIWLHNGAGPSWRRT